MVRLSIRSLVQAAGLSGSYGGIKVAANSYAGSLDTLHFLFDDTIGFAAILKMFNYEPNATLAERDYAGTGTWTLRAPMLSLSNPDPALGFPIGTSLDPQLFIRNTTSKTIMGSLRFNWRAGNTTGKAAGPSVQLAPYQTQRIDVTALQAAGTLPMTANWASVILATNSNPDEVMAVAASYDPTYRYGTQTPFSDQLTFEWKGGVWQYDAFHDSIITAGNGGTQPVTAAFTIFYNQGTQRYELDQTLQPDDQMWVDVGQLIRNQLPDKNGNALPAGLTAGTYMVREISNKGAGTLFEGKVIYDKMYGHASYGCALCCGYATIDYGFWYNPIGIPDLGTADQGVNATNECDGGQLEDVSGSFYGNWTTANSSIATVDHYGTHTGVSVGSTTSNTHGQLNNNDVPQDCPLFGYNPSGNDNTNPSITSINPDIVAVATTNVQVIINGYGFGSSPTVNLPQGVSNLGQSATNTKITLTISVSTNAPIGLYSISVAAGGGTSSPSSFTLDGPVEGVVASDSLFHCHDCTTAWARKVTMQVMNFSGTAASSIFIGESAPASGWNCTQSNPGVSTTNCGDNYETDSNGYMADQWSIASDAYSPVGCGFNFTTHWQWCAAGRTFLTLSGYTHTNAIDMNGVVNPPNSFPVGKVITP